MSKQAENYLQITGKAYLDQPLKKDKAYVVTFRELTVYGMDERTGNGEADKITYKAKSTADVLIQDENDVVIGKPRKSSMSQQLRRVIMENYNDQEAGNYDDFETYYNERMSKLIEQEKNLYL